MNHRRLLRALLSYTKPDSVEEMEDVNKLYNDLNDYINKKERMQVDYEALKELHQKEHELLKGKYKYLVVYKYGKENGISGDGRVYIEVNLPIKTQKDVENIEEYIKMEYECKNAFITNYIKLSNNKKKKSRE